MSQTSVYLNSQRQMQAQGSELEKARKMVETLQRECEGLKHSMQGLLQQVSDVSPIAMCYVYSSTRTLVFSMQSLHMKTREPLFSA